MYLIFPTTYPTQSNDHSPIFQRAVWNCNCIHRVITFTACCCPGPGSARYFTGAIRGTSGHHRRELSIHVTGRLPGQTGGWIYAHWCGRCYGCWGIATLASGGDNSDLIGYTLLGGGALFAGLGFLPLNIKSETERMYEEFGEKPSDTPEQIQQKYIYWDSRFYEYAREQRRGRILIGIISIGVGLAWISTAETSSTASTSSLSASALPLVIGGITSLAFRSKAEKRYAVYERSKAGVLGLSASAVQVNAGIVPLPGGQIVGVLQVRF